MRLLPSAGLVLVLAIGCRPNPGVTEMPEPTAAPTPSRSAPSPRVESSIASAAPATASFDRVDAPAIEPATEPATALARTEGSLSDLVCEAQGYGKSVHTVWLAAHDDLLACGDLQTDGTSSILNVSIWHGKPRHGGGPLPGHSAVIGTASDDVSDAAVKCLEELAARIETQLSPARLPARAECRARFERG